MEDLEEKTVEELRTIIDELYDAFEKTILLAVLQDGVALVPQGSSDGVVLNARIVEPNHLSMTGVYQNGGMKWKISLMDDYIPPEE